MNDGRAVSRDVPRLLKRLYRFRQRMHRPGIGRLLLRSRKAALLASLAEAWPGAYVLTDCGELAYVPAPLDASGARLLFYGLRAPKTALGLVPPGGVAIDVGANLGEWSVPLARTVGRNGMLLCIEPNPAVATALAATLRINNLTQAEVLAVALASQDGEGRLLIESGDSGLSRLSASDSAIAVSLRRLDTILREHEFTRLDLIKIDVEGHERYVLIGAVETLHRFRPAVVFESGLETPEDRHAIAALFKDLDYDLIAVLHDYGALPCGQGDYVEAAGACAGSEARNILALPRMLMR